MNRRGFLKNSVSAIALLAAPAPVFAAVAKTTALKGSHKGTITAIEFLTADGQWKGFRDFQNAILEEIKEVTFIMSIEASK